MLCVPHWTGLNDKKSPGQENFATSLHRNEGKTTVSQSIHLFFLIKFYKYLNQQIFKTNVFFYIFLYIFCLVWTLDKLVTENSGKQSLTDLIYLKIAGQSKGIMDKMATVNNDKWLAPVSQMLEGWRQIFCLIKQSILNRIANLKSSAEFC